MERFFSSNDIARNDGLCSLFRLRFHGSMSVGINDIVSPLAPARRRPFSPTASRSSHIGSDDSHDSPTANENERFEQANSSYSHIERRS